MRSNKGFTLVELLGVIIVIGIVSLIAIPSIAKYIDGGKLTTFIAYEKSMKTATDNAIMECIENNSYRCDIPDNNESGKVDLLYLIEEGFLDEIKVSDGETCDINRSFVNIKNINHKYEYDVCLYCSNYTSESNICN